MPTRTASFWPTRRCTADLVTPTRDNVFAGDYVDRLGHRRKDTAWLDERMADPATQFVPVWNTASLIEPAPAGRARFLDRDAVEALGQAAARPILLGRFAGRVVFAVDLGKGERDTPPPASHGQFRSLRTAAMLLPADEAALLAYAQGMVLWDRRHRYCGRCGAATDSRDAGHVRVCPNEACGQSWFPRIDPAIIVLVTDGDRALLGRQASWPTGVYSTIAGFAEPGESLEDAVAREVMEETGVVVKNPRYHSSQPWPFPSSLMLGFTATAVDTRISLNDNELEDARWFTRDELLAGYGNRGPTPPSTISIAFRLVSDWYDDGHPGKLAAAIDTINARAH